MASPQDQNGQLAFTINHPSHITSYLCQLLPEKRYQATDLKMTTTPVTTPVILMTPTAIGGLGRLKYEVIRGCRHTREPLDLKMNACEGIFCTPSNLSSEISRPVQRSVPVVPDLVDLQQPHDFDRPRLMARRGLRGGLPRPTLRPKAAGSNRRSSVEGPSCLQQAANGSNHFEERNRPAPTFMPGLPTLPDASAMGQGGRRCRTLKPRLSR